MTAQATVLVVEDERPMRNFIQKNLAARGFMVHEAADGLEALAIVGAESLDLVILDVMMPHMNGLDTTRHIRQHSFVPIIILSALDEEADKVAALDLGADDYLTKPFGVEELLARVRAVLRRAHQQPGADPTAYFQSGNIRLEPETHLVTRNEEVIKLTPTEFNLLHYLMQNADKVLTHRAILQHVWGAGYGNETEYLRVYIRRLRQKLEEDPLHPRHIITEYGVGYRFERDP